MDGFSPIKFALQTPGSDEEHRRQIAHALTLGLPEIDTNTKRLHIVANGPTACGFNHDLPGDTMALNGSLRLFTDIGKAPTYWAACDPQKALAGFLNGPLPTTTTYLIASKCHPAVFERLHDYDVRLWHVNDQPIPAEKHAVPCAVSITLCAAMLAQRLGYRRLDMWGWDCCFAKDGSHHAGPGGLSSTPEKIEIEIDGVDEHFWITPTWGCEVEDARGILPVLKWCGTDVVIHGRSLISAICPEFAAEPDGCG